MVAVLIFGAARVNAMGNEEVRIHFAEEHVAALTGLSARQIRYWDTTGVYVPALGEPGHRLYSFRDLVALRTLSLLRTKLPLQELRKIGEYVATVHETPWASLTFYLQGRQVSFVDPATGRMVATRPRGQLVQPFEMVRVCTEMKVAVAKLQRRATQTRGKIVRDRRVAHNAWVIAGTRIPVETVRRMKAEGASVEEIVREYPSLSARDVAAALSFVGDQRRQA